MKITLRACIAAVAILTNLTAACSATLVWATSEGAAMSQALAQGKNVLLVAGRDTCSNTTYMRFTACECTSPNIRGVIDGSYVPWYCDVDASSEWLPYASGLGAFTLPLICCIDPLQSAGYLDRTTGRQDLLAFHSRLVSHAPGLWSGATSLGGGWKWLNWFGSFYDASNGWIYHGEHGWMYCSGSAMNSIFFWTQDMGWLWGGSTTYPSLYRFNDNAWLWYQRGSRTPRYFYNRNTATWEARNPIE